MLPTYLPTYLPACLPAYLPTCLPAYLPTYLPAWVKGHIIRVKPPSLLKPKWSMRMYLVSFTTVKTNKALKDCLETSFEVLLHKFFLKKCAIPGLFYRFFGLFKQTLQFLQQYM